MGSAPVAPALETVPPARYVWTERVVATGMLVACFVLLPGAAFANGTPTPTPKATARPNPSLAPSASTQAVATVTAEPTSIPAAAPSQPTPAPDLAATPAPAPAPPPDLETNPTVEPVADYGFSIWHGIVREGGAYRRAEPSAAGEVEEELGPGTPIRVDRWVPGSMLYPDVITWAAVDPEDGGGYVFGGSLAGVLPPAVPPPPEVMQNSDASWIDVNLTLDVVTVYESGQPLKMMLTSPGRPGYQTDVGQFSVRSKLPSQTMTGPGYVVPSVPSVEYFYGGEALHGRYWTLPDVVGRTSADVDDNGQVLGFDDSLAQTGGVNSGVAFGVPSSHGCLGLDVSDAAWLYSQTAYGTLVDVHY